jgi:peroxiredoxin
MGDPAEPDPVLQHPRILARTALKDLLDRLAFIGKEAPQFELETLDGQKVSPADFKGRILIIDFWATWCQPCLRELPRMKATYEEQHAKGLEILGLSLDEDKDRLAAFVEKEKIPWKQVYLGEKSNELGKLYGFEGAIPAVFLIDRAGMVRGMDLRGQVMKLQVAKLMKQEATPPPPGASIAEPQP